MLLSSVCNRDTSDNVVLCGGKPRNPQCMICILINHFSKGAESVCVKVYVTCKKVCKGARRSSKPRDVAVLLIAVSL